MHFDLKHTHYLNFEQCYGLSAKRENIPVEEDFYTSTQFSNPKFKHRELPIELSEITSKVVIQQGQIKEEEQECQSRNKTEGRSKVAVRTKLSHHRFC